MVVLCGGAVSYERDTPVQAHGKPLEAAGEVRALLALVRESPGEVQAMRMAVGKTLALVLNNLKILSGDAGMRDENLVKEMAVERTKLNALLGSA